MICGHCGTDNTPDSKFCKSCAAPLALAQTPGQPVGAPPPLKDFGQEMTEIGKRMGESFEKMGQQFGEKAGRTGKDFVVWWDRTLGFLSPLIGGLFAVVALLVIVLVADAIAAVSDHPAFWRELVDFAWDYMWLFVSLIFLGSFQNYFHRRYRDKFKWVNPVVSGVGFVAWFWIFAQLLKIAGRNSDHPKLGDLGNFIEDVLIFLFFLVVVIGYLILFFTLVSPANWDKKQ